jgi:hypothetical protein
MHPSPSETSFFGITWLEERSNKQPNHGSGRTPPGMKNPSSGLESNETKPSPKRKNQGMQSSPSLTSFHRIKGLAEHVRMEPYVDFALQGKNPSPALESSQVMGAPKIVGEQPSDDLTSVSVY